MKAPTDKFLDDDCDPYGIGRAARAIQLEWGRQLGIPGAQVTAFEGLPASTREFFRGLAKAALRAAREPAGPDQSSQVDVNRT